MTAVSCEFIMSWSKPQHIPDWQANLKICRAHAYADVRFFYSSHVNWSVAACRHLFVANSRGKGLNCRCCSNPTMMPTMRMACHSSTQTVHLWASDIWALPIEQQQWVDCHTLTSHHLERQNNIQCKVVHRAYGTTSFPVECYW